MKYNHSFHLVNPSPWPLMSALITMTLLSSSIMFFQKTFTFTLTLTSINLIITSYQWWRDMIRESTFQGLHTYKVTMNMKMGMILFITSEIMFFFSFFWSFFHSSLNPTMEIGLSWPPSQIYPFNPFQTPLLNTIILLSSGISITWAHHSMINKNHSQLLLSLYITISLGIYFTILQKMEYTEALFSLADSIYGSTFFITTGFHGIHVIIGTLFIFTCMMRQKMAHMSNMHHFGFEASAWYWHFVDIIWLFVFISLYWWGS